MQSKSHPLQNLSMPRVFLHLEGAAVLAASLLLYAHLQFNWGTFALFLLAPDLAIIAYAINKHSGQIVYNLVHTIVFPLALAMYSVMNANELGLQVSLIWFAHIGMDHMFGYGFKYPGQFKETHFSHV